MSETNGVKHYWLPPESKVRRKRYPHWPKKDASNLCGRGYAGDFTATVRKVTCMQCLQRIKAAEETHAAKGQEQEAASATPLADPQYIKAGPAPWLIDIARSARLKAEAETPEPKFDTVSKPKHYNNGKVECIDALEAATTRLEGIEAVCTANAIKYLWRWKLKNGVEDLKKAQWYIAHLIKHLGAPEKKP